MIHRTELSIGTNLGDGLSSVKEIAAEARKLGIKAFALDDCMSVRSFSEAEKAARETGVKIIYGISVIIRCEDLGNGIDFDCVTLLAKNGAGADFIRKLAAEEESTEDAVTPEEILRNKENLLVGAFEKRLPKQDYLTVTPYMPKKEVEKILEIGQKEHILVAAMGKVLYAGPKAPIIEALCRYDPYWDKPLLSAEEMLEHFSYLPKETAEQIVLKNPNHLADMTE